MSRRMTRSRAARTTALVASLSMAIPFPLYAQSGDGQLCADGSSAPCQEQEGSRPNDDQEQEQEGNRGQDRQQGQEQEPAPEVQPDNQPEEVPAEPEPEVRPDPAPEQQPVPDETPSDTPTEVPQPDQAPEIPANDGGGEQGLGDALNRALQGEQPAAEEEPSQEEQPEAEQPAERSPEAEQPAARSPEAEQPAEQSPEAEAPEAEQPAAEASDEDALRRALEQENGESDAVEGEGDRAPDSEQSPEQSPDAEQSPEANDDEATDDNARRDGQSPEQAPSESSEEEGGLGSALDRALRGEDAADEPAEEAADGGRPAEESQTISDEERQEQIRAQLMTDQPDAASGEPPALDALQALRSTDDDENEDDDTRGNVEVMEETVTEDNARSSSEDFENTVSERREDRADRNRDRNRDGSRNNDNDNRDRNNNNNNNDDDDDDDRWNSALSDREKVMLLGLGALAVGAVISNNRRVELNSGDRVVVQRPDGTYEVLKDDDVLLRQPGSNVRTEQFNDGSSRTTVLREDGSQIVTIYSPEMRVLRRTRIDPNGREYLLIDDTVTYEPVDVATLPAPRNQFVELTDDEDALRTALSRNSDFGRSFSLSQIRNISEVRSLVPVIDVNAITFETGSAAITPDQAQALASVGRLIQDYIDENPQEMFLIEGHTDAVGSAASNLALSDRRAESVALALTEYFDVPPENMVVQGYGEGYLRVESQGDERANRRAAVRRITDLLQTASN